jgi:uncharacterized membrane protein YtjA (UPF0391 family)
MENPKLASLILPPLASAGSCGAQTSHSPAPMLYCTVALLDVGLISGVRGLSVIAGIAASLARVSFSSLL